MRTSYFNLTWSVCSEAFFRDAASLKAFFLFILLSACYGTIIKYNLMLQQFLD